MMTATCALTIPSRIPRDEMDMAYRLTASLPTANRESRPMSNPVRGPRIAMENGPPRTVGENPRFPPRLRRGKQNRSTSGLPTRTRTMGGSVRFPPSKTFPLGPAAEAETVQEEVRLTGRRLDRTAAFRPQIPIVHHPRTVTRQRVPPHLDPPGEVAVGNTTPPPLRRRCHHRLRLPRQVAPPIACHIQTRQLHRRPSQHCLKTYIPIG